MHKYDIFISHASEDKESVARPLTALLLQAGVKVWIDESEILLGDGLLKRIEYGLLNSKYGIVILSKTFFSKSWPQKELDALVSLEDEKENKILPILHEIKIDDVKKYSPILANKLSENTSNGLHSVVGSILKVLQRNTDFAVKSHSPLPEKLPKSINDFISDFVDKLVDQAENKTRVSGITTGIPNLDTALSGLSSGDLIVIAGRPAMGSTSLAVNISEHIATKENSPVLYFSLQEQADNIVRRLVASCGYIKKLDLQDGRLSDEDWGRLVEAVESITKSDIYIDDTPVISIDDIIERSIETEKTHAIRISLIVIDRIELIENFHRSHDYIFNQLRHMARKLNCAIIAITGVDRKAELRLDKRPMLSEIIGSESIKLHASALICIYRDDYYNTIDSKYPGIAELIILQNRKGFLKFVEVAFIKEIGKFVTIPE